MGNELSRRQVLKIGLAGAAWPLARSVGAFALPEAKSLTFAYFSDTHIGLKSNVDETRTMLAELSRAIQPAFAINGGDVTDYGWEGEYANYKSLTQSLGYPMLNVPGNHDVRWSPLGMQVFRKHLGEPYQAIEREGALVAALDSTVPLSHWGHYERVQLEWLETLLKKAGRTKPVVLATHHWVGRGAMMVDNEVELLKLIEPYNVKLILTGHGHSDLLWEWNGILCTQNRGLYQGSYQAVRLDFDRGELTLSRRSAKETTLQQIARIPLRPRERVRPNWALSTAVLQVGQAARGSFPGAAEARWNGEDYGPLAETLAKSSGLLPGFHTLSVRTGEAGPLRTYGTEVRSSDSRLALRWRARLTGGVMSKVRLAGDLVVASCMDGSVHALRKSDGKRAWRAKTRDYCHSSPCIHGGRVVVGSADASVYCFDLKSGKELWRAQTGGPVYASPAVSGSVVGIASGDGKVYGLDLATGQELWSYRMPASNTNFSQSVAATDGKRFYVGAWDNQLYALEASSGALVWKQPCCPRTFAYSPAIGSPCVADGRVYVSANGNGLFSFDAATGEKAWEISSPGDKYGHSGPVVVGDRVVVGCLGDKGEVRCVSVADGKEIWCASTGKVIYDSSPAIADGLVAIGSVDSLLSLISLADGEVVAQFRLPQGHFLSTPAMEPGAVYAGTYSNELLAFAVR